MKYYSAPKKNQIMNSPGKQAELEKIIVNEVTRPKKTSSTCFVLFCFIRGS